MSGLGKLREEIDALDAELVRILSGRAQLVHAVADWKRENRKQVYDPTREQFILDRVAQLNPGPLSSIEIREMMALLIRGFRGFEERVRQEDLEVEALGVKKVSLQKTPIRKVSLVGMGLLGGSLALDLARRPDLYQLMGYDVHTSKKMLKTPAGRALHQWAKSPAEALDADIVVLAMPVLEIVKFLKKYRSEFRPGSLVTDVGSTKREICETAWRVLDPSVTFVGGHPLAGKAQSGIEAAESGLFAGKPYVLVPGAKTEKFEELGKMISVLKGMPWLCDADTHDQTLAFTSHLPQMASVALALAVSKGLGRKKGPVLHGPALRDMTRLAESDARMWTDIVKTNAQQLDEAMDELISELTSLKKSLGKTLKRKTLSQEFHAAKKARAALIGHRSAHVSKKNG